MPQGTTGQTAKTFTHKQMTARDEALNMGDDAFAVRQRAAFVRRPGERVWEFRRSDHHRFMCELQFKGNSWGWLATIYMDGSLLGGRRFMLRADAVESADEKLKTLV